MQPAAILQANSLYARGRLARAAPHGLPGDKRGLVRAKKHGTKSGSGASLQRGFSFGGWCLSLHSERIENFPRDVLFFLEAKEGLIWQNPNQGSN